MTEEGGGSTKLLQTMPYNIEAEKGLLGAIFVNNRAYEKVSEFLRPEHFAYTQHGQVFEAVGKLIERGQIADPVTLKRLFEADESLVDIGGPAYLADLAASAVTVMNAGEYGRLIYDLHLKREIIALGQDMVARANDGNVEDTAHQHIQDIEGHLYDIVERGHYGGGAENLDQALIKAIKIAEKAHSRGSGFAGITTGFRELNQLLGGFHPSDLIVLAGRPGMGKTALATNIAYNTAKAFKETGGEEGAIVGFFSLEMASEQLAARILSEQSKISSERIRKGELTNDEFGQLSKAAQDIHGTPFFIDETMGLSISGIRSRARRMKRSHRVGLIVVDYLQLIEPESGRHRENRVQEITAITRGLKLLAKDLHVPVLALSQLSRRPEEREDKRPLLSDLRDSGSIEQDADVVMFIYRDEYYLMRNELDQGDKESDNQYASRLERWEKRRTEATGRAEINVAKQRHGPVGLVALAFDHRFTLFSDIEG